MRVATLCYHSQNVVGNDYASNDHVALAQDLAALRRRGIPLIDARRLVEAIRTRREDLLPRRAVALTCDDGSLLDWQDYDHPSFGRQPSFDRILTQHLAQAAGDRSAAMTAFVIASPLARESIDLGCYGGSRLTLDDWWADAARSGRWTIGNHSWDHRHACLPELKHSPDLAQFHSVDRYDEARAQIARASDFIDRQLAAASATVSLFAYPYGHVPPYLVRDYLPRHRDEHGIVGAFTTEVAFTTIESDVFALPRFVCGEAWNSADQFERLLDRLVA